MKLLLSKWLRYLSDKSLARSIVTGTYDTPSNLDPTTKLILEEISKLGIKIVNGEGNEIVIMPDDFKHFWRKVNKFTSSSMSGVHYGHYKAAIQDELSSEVLACQLTGIARTGVPPKNWSMGLQVMFEKIARVCLVEKLCAIQLYEADFNCSQPHGLGCIQASIMARSTVRSWHNDEQPRSNGQPPPQGGLQDA
jgi:hypothetical protein